MGSCPSSTPPGPRSCGPPTWAGGGEDCVLDVEVDAAGNVFVVGTTSSADFPTKNGLSSAHGGGTWDGFVAQLSADGSQLVYGSYLGGSGMDCITDLELREPRVLTVGGTVDSIDFPTTFGAVQPAKAGARDFVVCRLDLDQAPAAQLIYSTFLGGSWDEGADFGIASPYHVQIFDLHLDGADRVTVVGRTASSDFPTTWNAFDSSFNGMTDVVLSRIDPSQPGWAGLVYSTLVGAADWEAAYALDVDASGVATVGGYTYSAGFPTTPGAFDTTFLGPAGFNDGFVLRLDPSRTGSQQLLYSTLLCGDGYDEVTDLVLDPQGKVVVQGWTGRSGLASNSFPTTCGAFSEVSLGEQDGFLLYLDPGGNAASDLLYATFLTGSSYDFQWLGLELVSTSPALRVVSAGGSSSPDFATTSGTLQPDYAGGPFDGTVLELEVNPHTYCDAAPNSAGPDGARICGSGSVRISDNAFTLSVAGAAPNNVGLFVYGATAAQTPFGNGTLCLSSPVHRWVPAVQIDPSGNASRQLDFTQPPFGSGPGAITPGSTWRFQLWYRDPAGGGAGFNLSNGLEATFHP